MLSLYHAAFLDLNASADPPRLLLLFAIACAKVLYFAVPLHIAALWSTGDRTMRFVALTGVAAMAGALLASGLIGSLVPTDRPFVIGLGNTLIDHRPSAAFPSNHAIVCFCWAATLAVYGRAGLAYAVAAVGLLVGWSRVYLGVHYPFDIVGGAALSGLAAGAAAFAMTRVGGRVLAMAEAVQARLLSIVARRAPRDARSARR